MFIFFFNYKLNTNYKSNSETVRILAEHILAKHFQYFTSVDEVLATMV